MAAVHADRVPPLLAGEDAAHALQGPDHGARQGRGAAGLRMDRVGGLVQDDLVARLAPDPVGDLVAHGARRQEQGGLLAQQLGGLVLKPVRGRVSALLQRRPSQFPIVLSGFAHLANV